MIQRGFTLLKIDDKNFDAKFFWNELTNILLLMTKNVARNSKLATLNEKEENFIISKQRSMQSLETAIENAFSETAAEKSLIVTNFLYLHLSVLMWANKHNLKKDWLIEYAYFFISQFSQDKNVTLEKVAVPKRFHYSITKHHEFEFNIGGWSASEDGESALEYKTRVLREFEKNLDEYLIEAVWKLKRKSDKL